jgi:flagellar hook-associated protein 2
MASSTFSVGGLASGLDTNSIVDKLVAIESRPITTNSNRQAAINVQMSSIADLINKIKNLSSSAASLKTSGIAAASVTSTPAGVSATVGAGVIPGRYSVSVETVATAAKARSTGFATSSTTVAGGTLALTVQGAAYNIAITASSDLGSVVNQINASGAPVSAAVVSNGSQFFVSLTNKDTGKPIGSGVTGGLTVVGDPTGLGMAVTQDAVNAKFHVDLLDIESQSNDVTSAIPGVTLTIKAQQLTASDLVIGRDSSKSGDNLQGFVDGFNAVMATLKKSLRPDPTAALANGSQMDGSMVLDLQRRMHGLLSTKVVAEGSYRTLADLGVKLQNDGTVTLDKTALSAAITKDSTAVNAIFSTATTGLAAQTDTLAKTYTDFVDGQLIQRQTSLKGTLKDLQVSSEKLQRHVDSFREQLVKRFSQMESLMSGFNAVSNFITNSPIMNPLKASK